MSQLPNTLSPTSCTPTKSKRDELVDLLTLFGSEERYDSATTARRKATRPQIFQQDSCHIPKIDFGKKGDSRETIPGRDSTGVSDLDDIFAPYPSAPVSAAHSQPNDLPLSLESLKPLNEHIKDATEGIHNDTEDICHSRGSHQEGNGEPSDTKDCIVVRCDSFPVKESPLSARNKLRKKVAESTKLQRDAFMLEKKDLFLPLLPPTDNYIEMLAAYPRPNKTLEYTPVHEYQQVSDQPDG